MVTLEGYSFLLDHMPSGISMYILATRAGVDCHIAATGDADLVRAVRSQIAAVSLGDLVSLRHLVKLWSPQTFNSYQCLVTVDCFINLGLHVHLGLLVQKRNVSIPEYLNRDLEPSIS